MVSPTLNYQLFRNHVADHLLKAYNSITLDQTLPADALSAHISLIPKEGGDPADTKNFIPISLLNIDLKLFTKILATRLATWIP